MRGSLLRTCMLASGVVLFAAEPAPAGSGTWQRFEVPGEGAVMLQVPDAWVGREQKLSGSQTSVEFGLSSGNTALFNVTLLIEKPPEEQTGDGEKGPAARLPEMREKLVRTRDGLAAPPPPGSRKHPGVPVIYEFHGDSVTGYYFSFSGKRAKPDRYRYVTIGTALLDEVPIQFIVSSNESPGDQVAETLAMLKSARWEPPESEDEEGAERR